MRRYTVTHRYTSWRDGKRYGPWRPGTEVELSDDEAAWVERDSAGTLKPVEPETPPLVVEPPARQAPPARDRQHRGGRKR